MSEGVVYHCAPTEADREARTKAGEDAQPFAGEPLAVLEHREADATVLAPLSAAQTGTTIEDAPTRLELMALIV